MTGALAAALVAMAARFSAAQLPDAEPVAGRADGLRYQVAGLADQDAAAYQAVLDAYALPPDTPGRRERIRRALHRAATVPLEIAEVAARTGALAARLAAQGNPNLRGDAVTAAHLAEASARSAGALVGINVRLGGLPAELGSRAAAAVAAAEAAAAEAVEAAANEGAANEAAANAGAATEGAATEAAATETPDTG